MIGKDFNDKIGPIETVIFDQRFYSCFGCKYFHHEMQYQIYTFCKKMNYKGDILDDSEICLDYYLLSYSGVTPNCCPYLKSNIRDDKLNKIL